MRTIYILRGAPASGKSSWVENNKLEPYTLSADKIRLMYQSPVLNKDGNFVITQQNDGQVWKFLFQMLEDRMARGEFVVVDATHYKSELLNRYKQLISKYRYRAFVVDFTNIDKEMLLKRNSERDEYKRVPEETICKMCAVFEQDTEVNSKFNILTPEEAVNKLSDSLIFDYNNYKKVVLFGDIHGCYNPLSKYFDENPFNEDNAYIFVGDYLDRGIQNKEVVEWLLKYKDYKNVLLLEGNHEKWLRMYADNDGAEKDLDKEDAKILRKYVGKDFFFNYNKNKIRSSVFKEKTIPQIECFNKKDLRQLCRKFGQMAYFKFNNSNYFVCHGGISSTPNIFISTEELISGVGKYEDVDEVYDSWLKNTSENDVLIHGHRNVFDLPAEVHKNRIYNLCSNVEFGDSLRVVEIDDIGIRTILIKNDVFDKNCTKVNEKIDVLKTKTDNSFLEQLNTSKLIKKKILDGGIVSYNFSRSVFTNRKWNDLTCKARGLFIDAKTEKVIARSYNKFFNWSEVEDTKSENLKKNLKFPVKAFKKENGFLALVSYDWNTDNLLVCSKSTNAGDYVGYIKEELNKLDNNILKTMKTYCREQNVTLVFECVNQDKDPHIIKYNENSLFLLDVVYNSFEFKKLPYEIVRKVGDVFGISVKKHIYTFNNWEQLYSFKKEQDNSYDIRHEGWVFEDANGFMVKYKTRYYKFWKMMRGVKERLEQGNNVKKIFSSEDEVRVFNLLKSFEREELKNMSIIDIEEIYYNS